MEQAFHNSATILIHHFVFGSYIIASSKISQISFQFFNPLLEPRFYSRNTSFCNGCNLSDFQIIIKIAEDLAPEISNIIRTTITNNRINLAVQHTSSPDWTECDSAKVENIRRKIKAVMHIDDTADPALNRVIGLYVDYYISGMENMSNLRIGFPEIYEDLYRLEQSFKNEVSIKTLMNTDHLMNQSVFSTILSDFGEKLEKDFSTIFNQASIAEVKQDLIASWLADCSMEFRSM